ncbi:hypothetical protein QCD79_30295, partial [Pseudomonas quasicaspiana]|nr:hypothetical protein [Pseudomonas quasicaspiana]
VLRNAVAHALNWRNQHHRAAKYAHMAGTGLSCPSRTMIIASDQGVEPLQSGVCPRGAGIKSPALIERSQWTPFRKVSE